MKERWMGLDYGTKTVGVAVSDALGITAQYMEAVPQLLDGLALACEKAMQHGCFD